MRTPSQSRSRAWGQAPAPTQDGPGTLRRSPWSCRTVGHAALLSVTGQRIPRVTRLSNSLRAYYIYGTLLSGHPPFPGSASNTHALAESARPGHAPSPAVHHVIKLITLPAYRPRSTAPSASPGDLCGLRGVQCSLATAPTLSSARRSSSRSSCTLSTDTSSPSRSRVASVARHARLLLGHTASIETGTRHNHTHFNDQHASLRRARLRNHFVTVDAADEWHR
jgi:hypothetical protein